MLSAEDRGYAAGLVDGRAWLGASRARKPNRRHGVQVTVRLSVTSTDYAYLVALQQKLGGRIGACNSFLGTVGPTWLLTLSGYRLADLLREVAPLLLTKGAQARACLALLDFLKAQRTQPLADAAFYPALTHLWEAVQRTRARTAQRVPGYLDYAQFRAGGGEKEATPLAAAREELSGKALGVP